MSDMLRSHLLGLFFALTPVLTPALLAQGKTWIVDAQNGPGTNFKDIQAAVNKASVGDRIVVRKGNYGWLTVSRGVTIVGEPGVNILFFGTGIVTVSDVPRGETVILRGLDLLPPSTSQKTNVTVRKCKGRVLLDRIRQNGDFLVEDSEQVEIRDSSGFQLLANRSRLTALHLDILQQQYQFKISGVVLYDCDATLAGCSSHASPTYSITHSAIMLNAKTNLFLTGDGTRSYVARKDPLASSTPAIDGAGVVYLDPRVVLKPYGSGPAVGSSLKVVKQSVPYLSTTPAPLGGRARVELAAQPKDLFVLVIGLPGAPVTLPGWTGTIWVDLNAAFIVSTGSVDTAGRYRLDPFVPADPTLLRFSVVWQAIAGPTLQSQQLSNASGYVHYR